MNEALQGTIIESNAQSLLVRLNDGREVRATLPKSRKFGCLFGSLVGYQVKVAIRPEPKLARIIELSPPST